MAANIDAQNPSDLTLPCRAWFSSVTFRDGTVLDLEDDDTVVLVGANNSGKSDTLRSIVSFARKGAADSPVVKAANVAKSGTSEDLLPWLTRNYAKQGEFPNYSYLGFGLHASEQSASVWWSAHGLSELTPLFIHTCRSESRLIDSNTPNAIAPYEAKSHPLHRLYDDADLEERISTAFHDAFGTDLVINWRGGTQIPVHVGRRPVRTLNADRVSNEYTEAVKKLPLLSDQGDGMRSFASLLFVLESMQSSVLLIDEPEAFLHPPQARRIGETIARARKNRRQIIVATHSTDVLRGILSAGQPNTKIVRLSRAYGQTTRVLQPSAIEQLWSDPILRFSNALDGLFHEGTVLCEADADCRFYEAIAAAVQSTPVDLHFTYTAGKDRLPTVQRALKALGVTVAVIADFDAFQQDKPLEELVDDPTAWQSLSSLIKTVRTTVSAKAPTLSRSALTAEILALLGKSTEETLSDDERQRIRDLLRGTSLWGLAKTQGEGLFSGQAARDAKKLLAELQKFGIHIVPIGELESFCRTVGGHGPRWVSEVLKRRIKDDPELGEARAFVDAVLFYFVLYG